jgi:extracellular sulfatase Sulf
MASTLTAAEKSFMHDTLEHMKGCKGKSCILPRKHHAQIGQDTDESMNNVNLIPIRGNKRKHNNLHLIENDTSESQRRRQTK